MGTTDTNRYQVRVDGADVLLFRIAADGTTSLRTVTRGDWLEEVSYTRPGDPPTEPYRRVFAGEDISPKEIAAHKAG
jgi:hypothetical protein